MLPRNADPFAELQTIFRDKINEHIQQIPTACMALVTASPNPLKIRLDGLEFDLEYEQGDFIISNHLNLEVGDRVIVMPINNGAFHMVIGKLQIELPVENAMIGHNYNGVFVGVKAYTSQDRSDRYVALHSTTWSKIRGVVGGVIRTLTHLGHYHQYSVITTSTSAGPGDHSHTVTIPNVSATNPE